MFGVVALHLEACACHTRALAHIAGRVSLYGRFLVEALSRTTNHNVEHLGEQPLYGRFLVEALSKTSNHKVGSFFHQKNKVFLKKPSHCMIAPTA